MEITIARWETCSRGYVFGSGGFYVDLDGFSKLGRLYLQRGMWNGRRLLSEDWVAASAAEHIETMGDEEIGRGYGYFFWTMPNGRFRADGKFEQYALVCPDKNAVVTIKADNQDAFADRPILRAALRHIVTQL